MACGRGWHTTTLLPDGTVLAAGGETVACNAGTFTSFGSTDSSELYDASTGAFTPTGKMTISREEHTATLLNDGTVLITGGISWQAPNIIILNASPAAAEIYHPAVLTAAPALFSLSGETQGQGAIWNSRTGQIASSNNAVVAGDVLTMYTTSLIEGGVIPPQVAVGGQLAEVLFFGDAPGFPGYNQVNFRVPGGTESGPAVPVRLTYIGRSSNQVTIGVQ